MARTITLSDLLPEGHRRTAKAHVRLREAYVNLFHGNGNKEDADLVLVDLMQQTGYFQFLLPTPGKEAADPHALLELNGSRRIGARIMYQLNMPLRQLDELQTALASENMTSDQEGEMT